ncbi:unnamed protein product, partial [Linum tenue]
MVSEPRTERSCVRISTNPNINRCLSSTWYGGPVQTSSPWVGFRLRGRVRVWYKIQHNLLPTTR